jgi:hypothetical protein
MDIGHNTWPIVRGQSIPMANCPRNRQDPIFIFGSNFHLFRRQGAKNWEQLYLQKIFDSIISNLLGAKNIGRQFPSIFGGFKIIHTQK